MQARSGTRKKTSLPASSSGARAGSLGRYSTPLAALAVAALGMLASLTLAGGLTLSALWLAGSGVVAAWAWLGAPGALRGEPAADGFGQYTLHEQVGEGAMGVVYRATHALLRRPAAVKLLAAGHDSPESRERFEREVQLTSRLSHPNTIAVYDFGHTPAGMPFYAMEYLDGLDLQTLVDRHGPQVPKRVAHLLAQPAGSLAEAHGIGLIHRDVKPANVMLCERGGAHDVVKVLDFGLTKELGSSAELEDPYAGRVVGTPLYLSPEAIVTPESLDARSDIYAVGALGYFLLTGAPPFTGTSVAEVCAQHLHAEPRAISQEHAVPPALAALLLRCLAKSPADRPASAAELRAALLELAADWTEDDAHAWWDEHANRVSSPPAHALAATARTEHAAPLLQLAG